MHSNSLPSNKILDSTKLKPFAEDKLNGAKMIISGFDWAENILEKREATVYQHFFG